MRIIPGENALFFTGCTPHVKLCENTKNYKFACPGANKVVYGACEQESEEKNSKFWFLNMQN